MSESLTIKAGIDGTAINEGLKRIEANLKQFSDRLVKSFAVLGAALEFKEAMDKAFELGGKQEELIEGMATLAGGTEQAKQRLAEMADLIQHSPFGKQQFVDAYKSLQLYTNGLYSNNKALKLAGDVAAATGIPIEGVSEAIGLAYESIASGEGGGRALTRLMRLGAVSQETAIKIGRMGMGKANAGAVWQVLETELMKFDGTMEEKSHSWEALMKNFKLAVDSIYEQFAQPVMDALKPMLEEASIIASQVATYAKAAGEAVAKVIKVVIQAFREGQVISIISDGLILGFKVAINYLYAGFQGVAQALGYYLGKIPEELITGFSVLLSPTFWKGVGEVALGGLEIIGTTLMTMMVNIVEYLAAGLATAFATAINGVMNLLPGKVQKALGITGLKADENFDSNLAKAKQFFSPTADAISKTGDSARAMTASGLSDINTASKPLQDEYLKILAGMADEFSKGFKNGLSSAPFGDVADATNKFAAKITKLLGDFDASVPKDGPIKNPFREQMIIPQQMSKGVADSFASIGAGGRVSSYQHFDPMVEQQKQTNEKLDVLIDQGADGDDDAPTPRWNSVN